MGQIKMFRDKKKSWLEETFAKRVKLMPRVKKKKIRIEILTLNKLFTRLLVLLEQIKAGNNSCKLKIKLDK